MFRPVAFVQFRSEDTFSHILTPQGDIDRRKRILSSFLQVLIRWLWLLIVVVVHCKRRRMLQVLVCENLAVSITFEMGTAAIDTARICSGLVIQQEALLDEHVMVCDRSVKSVKHGRLVLIGEIRHLH